MREKLVQVVDGAIASVYRSKPDYTVVGLTAIGEPMGGDIARAKVRVTLSIEDAEALIVDLRKAIDQTKVISNMSALMDFARGDGKKEA